MRALGGGLVVIRKELEVELLAKLFKTNSDEEVVVVVVVEVVVLVEIDATG